MHGYVHAYQHVCVHACTRTHTHAHADTYADLIARARAHTPDTCLHACTHARARALLAQPSDCRATDAAPRAPLRLLWAALRVRARMTLRVEPQNPASEWGHAWCEAAHPSAWRRLAGPVTQRALGAMVDHGRRAAAACAAGIPHQSGDGPVGRASAESRELRQCPPLRAAITWPVTRALPSGASGRPIC